MHSVSAVVDVMKRARDDAWQAWLRHVQRPIRLRDGGHEKRDLDLWEHYVAAQTVLNAEMETRQILAAQARSAA